MKIKQIPTLEHECCSQDTITAVVIDDKYEVIIGTTEEIITSYSNAYRIARGQDTLAVSIYPRIVSATKETMDIYWLNHWANILADDQGKIASWKPGKVIYQYCIDFLSERGAELSTSNFVINEHKVLIDEPFNPDLSNGAQSNHTIICGGKDVVDSNEQEAVIGATA